MRVFRELFWGSALNGVWGKAPKITKIMFIHLSNNESVSDKHVVGIFDLETASKQPDTREFLKTKQKEMRTVTLGNDIPESFVLCDDEYAETVYFACLSAKALSKRGKKLL